MTDSAREWFYRAEVHVTQGDVWPFLLFGTTVTIVLLIAVLLPTLIPIFLLLIPFVLLMAIATGVVLFARAWGREFLALMRLGDHDFPGRFDKLVWAALLILAPPVGVWMFGAYRAAHWGEDKAAEPVIEV